MEDTITPRNGCIFHVTVLKLCTPSVYAALKVRLKFDSEYKIQDFTTISHSIAFAIGICSA